MKNIVVIHLESLNNAFLFQNSNIFPNIMKWKEKSIFFNNYYSTATSTIMTISDFMYGNSQCHEKSTSLVDFKLDLNYETWDEGLREELNSKKIIIYPVLDWKYDAVNIKKIMKVSVNQINEYQKYQKFQEAISNSIRIMDGELLYIYDWSSLRMKQNCEVSYNNWNEYYFNQYRQIDTTLGFIFEELQANNKLKDTIVVAYGDHGDDIYSYGKNNGFTHAIAPYPNIVKVPLMIYSEKLCTRELNNLICTYDIGNVLKSLYTNQDVIINRKYVFSRNLFPLQKSDILEKSYAVTNGVYLLLISSKGLKMYMCNFMGQNIFNILNWYELKKGKNLVLKKNSNMHFQRLIADQKEDIENNFYLLRNFLCKEIRQMKDNEVLKEKTKSWFFKIDYDWK